MATTTPNFGWSVPTSTDLVKDGATAIETLGDSIDASFLDLKGGTTGQFLSKASNTDLDFSWGSAASGLTKISTTNFSAVTNAAVTFASATYQSYKVFIKWTQTATGTLTVRVRSGGTDLTGSVYNTASFFMRSAGGPSGTHVQQNASNTSNLSVISTIDATTSINQFDILVGGLFETASTSMSYYGLNTNGAGEAAQAIFGANRVRDAVSYDGLNFAISAGTMSGKIIVCGVTE
jgi:hypothetical protein